VLPEAQFIVFAKLRDLRKGRAKVQGLRPPLAFSTLLHQLLTAQLRVRNLELPGIKFHGEALTSS